MEGQRPQEEFHGRDALENCVLACAAAIIYYALARIGLQFELGPLGASLLWPAAGFALAAVLLWGPSAASGVFLGAWLAYERPLLADGGATLATVLAASALAALGSAAQALLGAALLRRFGSPQDAARSAREAAVFCALVPVIGLISPIFQLLALMPSGILAGRHWAQAGFTWWIGEAVGMLTVTPLILVWAGPGTRLALPTMPRAA